MDIRSYGKIIVAPDVKVRVELSDAIIKGLNESHMFIVIEKQKQVFKLLNETL